MVSNTKRSSISISREDIKLSDMDILRRYIGIDSIPCTIKSLLREDDDTPSFVISEYNNMITWRDFGTGEHGSLISLLGRLWNCNYKEALLKIKLDTEQTIPRFNLIRRYRGKIHLVSNSSIKVKIRDWEDLDREFWNSFGISQNFCTWCNVHPVSHAIFIKKDDNGISRRVTVPMDKYAYAYFEWKDGKESIKLYQPYSQTMKWLSKHDSSVWDLWKHTFYWAKKKDSSAVIITSSRKDAMCLWENLKIPCMSLQGEGYFPKPQVMQEVLDTFESVYLWYDNDFKHKDDNPGQDNAKKLIEEYPQLKNIVIPEQYKSKDPSDLVKNWGVETLIEIWQMQK